jgi:hypothetical protein
VSGGAGRPKQPETYGANGGRLPTSAGGAVTNGGGSVATRRQPVWILQGARPFLRWVQIGLSDGVVTEVVTGLQAGDRVVVGRTGGTERERRHRTHRGMRAREVHMRYRRVGTRSAVLAGILFVGLLGAGRESQGFDSVALARLRATNALPVAADLSEADLRGAKLHGAILHVTLLDRADLRGADLSAADLSYAYLGDVDLHLANLAGAILYLADLDGADLSGADLRGADLRTADLRAADLRGADLTGAILTDADLREAKLSRATMPDGSKHP